ncbi:MAG: serine/threonine protein kinase [Nannocystis sp.]|uniref:serine/threonine protein kinase n=1 Tax=Nannocystis sp. TaxID=1962667 RepID=UPI002426BC89|nr:serine/threonine-protein kinase [Nannocystis sp.]MBK9756216.1 serine/threonine protein kinase [Nannocystis sp.]
MLAEGTPLPLIAGRFRLLRLLAVGGMGELYLAIAKDTEIEGLEQLVVMKRILPEFATDRDVVTMFLIEARIAARLDHPNVVRVYDMGRADGSLYFTMEYLHGADLGRLFDVARARGGDFPLGHALTIILCVCAGLHFAHEMCRVDGRPLGIVHRDVSPGNVFITYNGEVKMVDFGIAKVLSPKRLTLDGTRKGKVAYMSPEQVGDQAIDRRSDVFAIGILLYELVTLTHLFDGENEYAIMDQIAKGEVPPPSTRRPGIAPELERIILKALALAREDRYSTALELAEDLERFAYKHEVRVSTLAVKQFLRRMIGDVEYPWYLDEEGPEEAAAVQNWFATAQPDEVVDEVEVDISLSDLFQVDEELYEDDPITQELPAVPVAPAPTRPRRELPRRQLLVAAGIASLAAALWIRRCRLDEPPPPLKPAPAAIEVSPPPPASLPPAPPVAALVPAAAPETIVVPPAPTTKPAKKNKKKKKNTKKAPKPRK